MIEETRGRLLAAAREAFATDGYYETSMDELCSGIGLTRGSIYHHFGSKEGLFEAVLIQIYEEIGARLEAVYRDTPLLWDAFAAVCSAYLRMSAEPEIRRIVVQEAPSVMGDRLRAIDAQGSLGPLTNVLSELITEGEIIPVDAPLVARMLNAALLDASFVIGSSVDPETTASEAEKAVTLMLEGLWTDRKRRRGVTSR